LWLLPVLHTLEGGKESGRVKETHRLKKSRTFLMYVNRASPFQKSHCRDQKCQLAVGSQDTRIIYGQ
jgi:hypothetical protein